MISRKSILLVLLLAFISLGLTAFAQSIEPTLYQEMRWRFVGPFRGGRALTAVGVPGNPGLYYFGSVGGGVWKSTDAGLTWQPIFDSQPIASIGAMAVAPSDHNIIYVGSGEADMRSDIGYGNGMYKSADGGKTWTHIGLPDTRQIGRVLIDPKNPDVAFVAALGHAYGPNRERGVFRTTDGGKTWQPVLQKNDDTGAIDLAFDPQDSRVIYAALWQTRRTPWNVYPPSNGPGSGLYKSTDGGNTWQQLTNGLPTEGLGRIGIAVAPTDRNRVYAIVDAKQGGLYRSDDAGGTWKLMDSEARIWGRGWYFGVVEVDPKNADVVYVANTQMYKSTDGGRNFAGFKGAPGGDDYHSIWISPDDPNRMIVSTDQGTIVTLNGGESWSSWYNQPTGQIYHVSADNSFPYRLYGAQQDSGAVSVPSRSTFASITERDYRPIPVGGESGTLAPDPLNAKIVFGGTVDRFDWRTYQSKDVSPTIGRQGPFRTVWTLPIIFSQADKRKLYFSHQMLFRTTNGGESWDQISPDLTRETPEVPANLDPITAKYGLDSPRKGVIYAIGPSPLDPNLLWAGTDDGLIWRTDDDGKNWHNVAPAGLSSWSKIGIIEPSHFDKQTAYVAVDRHRIEDYRPHVYRTRDGGKSWQDLGKGIPDGAFVNAVREDPERRGLLYAGTELGVFVSFNDGDDWQPLQLNLPVTSVRDLVVHEGDLAIATHGRGFWILDDITPLRQITPQTHNSQVVLFKPKVAYRVRPGSDQGTPYPPETVPHAENPPNGAIIDYYLQSTASGVVTLEILDGKGSVVRKFASDEKPQVVNEKTLVFPVSWVHAAPILSAGPGMHRWVWDLQYPGAPGGGRRGGGIWAVPEQYTARLTVNGNSYTQSITVKLDPRVPTPLPALQHQFDLSQQAAAAGNQLMKINSQATSLVKQVDELRTKAAGNPDVIAAIESFSKQFESIVGPGPQGYGTPVMPLNLDHSSVRYVAGQLRQVLSAMQSADVAPTIEQESALQNYQQQAKTAEAAWQQFVARDLAALNAKLKSAGLSEVAIRTSR